ncbi:hypothetical protein [Teredinibacter turnerae]|uniref:hypothetical protein n=1 Tax=Teredinibacter turnerae TaxID=2426 RepID=UPI000419F5E9|nr:hypothetical protein [Teredinibacter turnerae]
MEAVSLSMLVGAVSAALVSGAKDVTENAVKDTYSAIKSKISELFGAESKPSQAMQLYEDNTDVEAYKTVMEAEFQRHNVLTNDSLQKLTAQLIDALQQTEQGSAQFSKYVNQGETTIGLQGDSVTVYGDVVGKKM